MSDSPKTPVKKPYESPKLAVYGDIGQITLSRFKGSGNVDGGKGTSRKT
jgi:hypothetical protein